MEIWGVSSSGPSMKRKRYHLLRQDRYDSGYRAVCRPIHVCPVSTLKKDIPTCKRCQKLLEKVQGARLR